MNKINTYKGYDCTSLQQFYKNCKTNIETIAKVYCNKDIKDCNLDELGDWDNYIIEFIDFCCVNNIITYEDNVRFIVVWKPYVLKNYPDTGRFTIQIVDRKKGGKILYEKYWG